MVKQMSWHLHESCWTLLQALACVATACPCDQWSNLYVRAHLNTHRHTLLIDLCGRPCVVLMCEQEGSHVLRAIMSEGLKCEQECKGSNFLRAQV